MDPPGVHDHILQQRNTIKMQSIKALAHLRSTIFFLVDPSEKCDYSLEKGISLFKSTMPFFPNKSIVFASNKTDLRW